MGLKRSFQVAFLFEVMNLLYNFGTILSGWSGFFVLVKEIKVPIYPEKSNQIMFSPVKNSSYTSFQIISYLNKVSI